MTFTRALGIVASIVIGFGSIFMIISLSTLPVNSPEVQDGAAGGMLMLSVILLIVCAANLLYEGCKLFKHEGVKEFNDEV